MSGIDRLRAIAGTWDEWGLGGTLADIADEIERERACDADTIENVRLIVGHVIDGMERHCLGHEGMEDSPVARWARELRDALKSDTSEVGDTQTPSWHDPAEDADVTSEAAEVTRDPAEDVSMSAYDLLPEDERDAIAWVREHGGLDYVRTEWRSRVPRDRYKRRRQRLLGHIAECETALGRRNVRIEELGRRVGDLTRENAELRKRSMPEGCEWPRYESGESVGLGDDVSRNGEDFEANVIALYRDGSFSLNFWAYSRGERVKRPAPKVLDADGVEIRVGDTVYHVKDGSEMTVFGIEGEWLVVSIGSLVRHDMVTHRASVLAADGEPLEVGQTVWDTNGDELVVGALEDGGYTVTCRYADVGDGIPVHGMWSPSDLTHQRPVLDADGVPIKVGDTVWKVGTVLAIHMTVVEVSRDTIRCEYAWTDGKVYRPCCSPDQLTHTKPEPPDSWKRVEDDARWMDSGADCGMFTYTHEDLVRRCRALAERERGE